MSERGWTAVQAVCAGNPGIHVSTSFFYEVSRKKGTHCNEEEGRFVHLDPGHADDGYALAVVRR